QQEDMEVDAPPSPRKLRDRQALALARVAPPKKELTPKRKGKAPMKKPRKTRKQQKGRGTTGKQMAQPLPSADMLRLTYTVPLRRTAQLKCCILCNEVPDVKMVVKKEAKDADEADPNAAEPEDDGYVTCSVAHCNQRMHPECVEKFICSEYTPKNAQLLFNNAGPVCPAHVCFHCFEERQKNTSRFGRMINCSKCVRTFHVQCLPAGAKTHYTSGKATFVCHCHTEDVLPIKEHMRMKICTECEEDCLEETDSKKDGDARMECRLCTNVFHKRCAFKEVRGLTQAYNFDLCSFCISGSTIVSGQHVLAYCSVATYGHPTGWYPAVALAIKDIPPNIKKILYGRKLGRVGWIPVMWVWKAAAKPFYDVIHRSRVQRITLSSYKNMQTDDFKKEVAELAQKFRPPTADFDNLAMMQTIKFISKNEYVGMPRRRLFMLKIDFECDCKPDANGFKCSTLKCSNRENGFECAPGCDEKGGICMNRGMQRVSNKEKFKLDEAPKGKGMGVFATETIGKLEYIFEYCGEVISKEELEKRQERMRQLRSLDEWTFAMGIAAGLTCDARFKGSAARYVNHSCAPNAQVKCVEVPVYMQNCPRGKICYETRLKVTALREIKAGEEITFKYELEKASGLALDVCKCGAKNCVGKIGAASKKDTNKDERYEDGMTFSDEEEEMDESVVEKKNQKGKKATAAKKTQQTVKRRASAIALGPAAKKSK
ncbi:hypothetical protein PMAYCL1PPCAC_03710, partial [Pristionchus mayeri]